MLELHSASWVQDALRKLVDMNKSTSTHPTDEGVQERIDSALWATCDVFRGTTDPWVYKDYVLAMLFLKYLSDSWDAHHQSYARLYPERPDLVAKKLEREPFHVPDNARFLYLYERRYEPFNGERIDAALHALEEANSGSLAGVFEDISFNSAKLGADDERDETLRYLLERFSDPELDFSASHIGTIDVVGNAFQHLVQQFAATLGKHAIDFHTPTTVSRLVAELIAPEEGDSVCDPACGSGSFLLQCAEFVRRNSPGAHRYALFGQESVGATLALARLNMLLHSEDNYRLEWGDTIRNPKLLNADGSLQKFDVVVGRPPFSFSQWGVEVADEDPFGRFQRGIPPRSKCDYAFILHMIATLKPRKGRMAVVVPHGVLFRGGTEASIRKRLIEDNLLDAVIGLPEKLLYGSVVPVVVLIFRTAKADNRVLFIDASEEFRAGKNQNTLCASDIDKIVTSYRARESVEQYAHLATAEEIAANKYNCNIPRYVGTFEQEEAIDLEAVRSEREVLRHQLSVLEEQMASYVKELSNEH